MSQAEVLAHLACILNALDIEWCLVGSYATSAHGQPRTTHDIDMQLALRPTDVGRLAEAIQDDYYVDATAIRDSFGRGLPHNLIHLDTMEKVDLWPVKDDEYERQAFARRIEFSHLGVPAYVQTAEDAILSKLKWLKLSQSDRHFQDALGVVLVQSDRLDVRYLRLWGSRLGILDDLEKLLSEAADIA